MYIIIIFSFLRTKATSPNYATSDFSLPTSDHNHVFIDPVPEVEFCTEKAVISAKNDTQPPLKRRKIDRAHSPVLEENRNGTIVTNTPPQVTVVLYYVYKFDC